MADAAAFELVSDQLAQLEGWTLATARGTVRTALAQCGLEARSVTPEQMEVVLRQILPEVLTEKGIRDATPLCDRLRRQLDSVALKPQRESPEAVFKRLGL